MDNLHEGHLGEVTQRGGAVLSQILNPILNKILSPILSLIMIPILNPIWIPMNLMGKLFMHPPDWT